MWKCKNCNGEHFIGKIYNPKFDRLGRVQSCLVVRHLECVDCGETAYSIHDIAEWKEKNNANN